MSDMHYSGPREGAYSPDPNRTLEFLDSLTQVDCARLAQIIFVKSAEGRHTGELSETAEQTELLKANYLANLAIMKGMLMFQ